jgi:DNA polymerase III subunit gamma/tau
VAEDVRLTEATSKHGPDAMPAPERPYQALYRRYRPQRFADVRGQEHVTRALGNAVREGRVAHAYLFSGPRGTGKTSTARILAMALNCTSPDAGEPDGTCSSCLAIRTGASMDVFELDAASNRKLDEMRDLLSRVALGTPGRWKVYIIDEVHQLTPDAASALLKTLEEPPSHVVFVLATTDPQKVLPTILSRTQHFEFHLLDGDLLTEILEGINTDAALGLSPELVRLAVEKGRGSARDAESALEQLSAAGGAEDDGAPLAELVDALAQRDVGQTLQAVARAISAGKEPRRLGNDMVGYLRNAFLATQAPTLVLLPAASTEGLAESARQMGLPLLVRAMETLGQALIDMRDSVDPRVTLEVALIRLASPAADTNPAALLERIERLERNYAERAERGALAPGPSLSGPGPGTGHAAPPSSRHSVPSLVPTVAPQVPAPAAVTTPSPTNPGAAQARVALGAFLKGGPTTANASLPLSGKTTAPAPVSGETTAPAPGVAAPATGAPPDEVRLAALPTRDELTMAWGDTVLAKLPRAAQVYMASGRFVVVGNGAAVFALPDPGLVARATNFVTEAENALADHFGRSVPLRLVLDQGGTAPTDPPAMPLEDESYDLDEMSDLAEATAIPAVPVEQRILEAFPGSVLDG